jgi:hypothetical protein
MKVSEMIQAKYPIEYYVGYEKSTRAVTVSFSEKIDADIAARVNRGLSRMLIDTTDGDSYGAVEIFIDTISNGHVYCVSVSGIDKYYVVDRDPVDAIVWIIYAVFTQRDWLQKLKDCDISSRLLSANQQYISAVLLKSANRQYTSTVGKDKIAELYDKLCVVPEKLISQAPLFSAQPITEEVSKQWEGGFLRKRRSVKNVQLGELAEDLYGKSDFMPEIEAFCKFIVTTDIYKKRLEEAEQYLYKKLADMPCLAIKNVILSLESLSKDAENAPDESELEDALERCLMNFSLSKDSLAAAFQTVDEYYLNAARYDLTGKFFEQLFKTPLIVSIRQQREDTIAKLNKLRSDLNPFCCLPDIDDESEILGWNKLADIQESDINSSDRQWTPTLTNKLREYFLYSNPCTLFICSSALYSDPDSPYLREDASVKPVPMTDNRTVVVFWAQPHKEGSGDNV